MTYRFHDGGFAFYGNTPTVGTPTQDEQNRLIRDEQERAIVVAAIAHVVAEGPCANLPDDHDPEYNPYCDDAECTYCALCRAMEGYEP